MFLVAEGCRSGSGEVQANPRTLDALFNSQLRYVVPMFQRLYVWQEEPQWKTLWEDIVEKADLQLRNTKSNPHYLGAVIIEGVRPSSPREVKRFLIIDGQQRLTTLQIVFCAYRDIARQAGWKTLDRATTRYIENADVDVMEHPDEERFKLWPTTLNRAVFSDIISAGQREAVEKKYPLIRLKRRRHFEPRNALVNAYVYFHSQIRTWTATTAAALGQTEENCAFALLQTLQQDFCVVEIALSEGDDSQEIFYSLNSQGRPLSQSDLLRSLIFMRAEKEKQNRDKIFDDYWSRFETQFWSTEISRAGRTYSRLDLGLRFFLMAKTGSLVDARRVNEEYRQWISISPPRYASVRDELHDLSRHCGIFERYETTQSGLPSTDFRRFVRDCDVSTVLPLTMFLELDAGLTPERLGECLGMIESFIGRRIITGEETKEYNKFFVEIIGTLRPLASDKIIVGLQNKLLSGGGTTRVWPSDAMLIENVISRPAFRALKTPALRLILERLELNERGKKSEEHFIPEGLHIEHVMPQQWAEHWPLNGISVPQNLVYAPFLAKNEFAKLSDAIRTRNEKLHTLGNLSLLNKYLNPAASNGSFDLKKVEYANSVLRLNRYFDGKSTWNEQAIEDRSKLLGQKLSKIWPRPAQE
jgi:hypothetical protein